MSRLSGITVSSAAGLRALLMSANHTEVDWRATYLEFDRAHGGDPMIVAADDGSAVLLWQDGWTHAMDYRGPLWPPPKEGDALRLLKLRYWQERLSIVEPQLAKLEGFLRGMAQMQEERAHAGGVIKTVQWQYVETEEGVRSLRRIEGTFNESDHEARLHQLRDDVWRCKTRIALLALDFDLYAELGVKPDADGAALKEAYQASLSKRLSFREDKAARRLAMRRAEMAYSTLRDFAKRQEYDAVR